MDPTAHLQAALNGRYTVERELGAGGMATVYLARDLRHARHVALKLLRPELGAVIGADRFLAEIRTTANLQHPHILPLFDSGAAGGLLWYAMPYVGGESLRQRLNREKQLPVEDALRITGEIASALDYAHRHGVIHRDIKPENILLHDGQALVADFGIALAVTHATEGRMTETGMSLGTPNYMSPEQAMGERELTARSDVYALGCVCYEMLIGEPPFTGPTAQAIVAKVLTAEPVPPHALRRSVPEHVDAALLRSLDKLPADRFGTAAEFAGAIRGGPSGRLATGGRPAPRRERTSLVVPTLSVITLAALAFGMLQAWRPAKGPVSEPVARFGVQLPLSRTAYGATMALSPDGSHLVFIARSAGGQTHLAVRPLDRLEVIDLPGTEGATAPFFSPDGQWVAFGSGSALRRIRIDGTDGSTITILRTGFLVGDGSWGHDNRIVFVDRGFGALYRVPADGGTATDFRASSDSSRYNTPSFLPGGKSVLASRIRAGSIESELVVVNMATGTVEATLVPGYVPRYTRVGYLVWSAPDSRLLARPFDPGSFRLSGDAAVVTEGLAPQARAMLWAVSDNGTIVFSPGVLTDKELVVVSSSGTTPLPVGSNAFRGPRFSRDGRRIAVDAEPAGDLLGDIWVFDRGSQAFTRITFDNQSIFPEWTPEGDALVYSSGVLGRRRALYRIPADGSGPPVQLLSRTAPIFEGVQLPDGTGILFREVSDSTGRDLYLAVGDSVIPWVVTRFDERTLAPSRDGRWVLYVSDESGRNEVYLKPLRGAARIQVSAGGGMEPRWGPDGRTAYYRWQDTLFTVAILPGPAVGPRRIALVGAYASEPFHTNYDVSPDGSEFVFVRSGRTEETSEVTVLLHWLRRPR